FTADFWYPLTDAQTLKEVSFKVNNKVESYIYFGANNANGLYVGRYGKRSSGYLGRNAGSATLANADGVDATVNTLDSLNASGSTALQKLTGGNSWTTISKTYVEGANGSTLETGGVPYNNTYDIVYTYEDSKTNFTIINSDGASMTDTIVEGTQKNYPVIRLISNSGKAYHISDINITYTEPVDVKAQVAEFVAANPFALDIRNDNIDLTGDLSQYKDSATALTAAYNAADEDLQATLTQYGYYDADVINVILCGADAINNYKQTHAAALGISALAVKDIAASYDSYKALYDAAVADLSSVESYIELGMGADIMPALEAAETSLAEALEYKNYIPEILGATIKNRLDNQDMRFAVNMSKNVPAGKEVAEYGMILADYRNITSGALSLADLNVDNTEDARVIIGKSKEASNNDLGTTYYVNVGGISEEDYGAPIIARAYVKFTDGSVVYSVATTDGADYAARTGVKDGYAVRSIISITKSMLVHLDAQGVQEVSSVAKIENGVITAYITAEGQESNVPDDAKRLFSVLQNNISYLANK
ncbi:MAG: hypothetical protein IJP22_00815, partial [Clostridia bacterium]|nr:hypothetical protein [Clostridia bacterium]